MNPTATRKRGKEKLTERIGLFCCFAVTCRGGDVLGLGLGLVAVVEMTVVAVLMVMMVVMVVVMVVEMAVIVVLSIVFVLYVLILSDFSCVAPELPCGRPPRWPSDLGVPLESGRSGVDDL